ncbi:MAG: 3-carboxy-cis,cis-muconate cycloisomerase [Paracoccaceae bacterium]|nr:3-carboxy-cis,cis-muconate cycloisomerase [Paracoccaceae bacterium]
MSYTVLNAQLTSGLLGDSEVAGFFTTNADIAEMVKFEAALAEVEASAGLISEVSARQIIALCNNFRPDISSLAVGIERDGLVVPDLVRQLRESLQGQAAQDLHFGGTSQDLIDTSLILRLQSVNGLFDNRLGQICAALTELQTRFGAKDLMARTRMQAALPTTVAHRILQWQLPLERLSESFLVVQSTLNVVQFGGPIGSLAALGPNGPQVRCLLAQRLGLNDPKGAWHTDRSRLLEYTFWLSSLVNALGKLGQDILLMSQDEREEIVLRGAGGSSVMGHKKNPVKAEILMALARFVTTLQFCMQQASVHEQERSGSAWALEWMVLPQLCIATGTALITAQTLLNSVQSLGAP